MITSTNLMVSNTSTLFVQTVAIVSLGNLLYGDASKEDILELLSSKGITQDHLAQVSDLGLSILLERDDAYTEQC